MNIEIGCKIWLHKDGAPLKVINIKVSDTGQDPMVYFAGGGDMSAPDVFRRAVAWA